MNPLPFFSRKLLNVTAGLLVKHRQKISKSECLTVRSFFTRAKMSVYNRDAKHRDVHKAPQLSSDEEDGKGDEDEAARAVALVCCGTPCVDGPMSCRLGH